MTDATDAGLDLTIARSIDPPPALVWRCWTEAELLKRWFCPRPWRLADCRIDLRVGGEFHTLMAGPEGEEFGNSGVFLEIVPERRLAFTDALEPGWRPAAEPFMSAVVTMEPEGSGTRYVATALHASAETRERHEAMGFFDGWNRALDQLIEVAARL